MAAITNLLDGQQVKRVTILIGGRLGTGKSAFFNEACGLTQGHKHYSEEGGVLSKTKGKVCHVLESGDKKILMVDLQGIEERKDFARLIPLIGRRRVYKNPILYYTVKGEDKLESSTVEMLSTLAKVMPVIVVGTRCVTAEHVAQIRGIGSTTNLPAVPILARSDTLLDRHVMQAFGMEHLVEVTRQSIQRAHLMYKKLLTVILKKRGWALLIISLATAGSAAAGLALPFVDSAIICAVEAGLISALCAVYGIHGNIVKQIINAIPVSVLIPTTASLMANFIFFKFVPLVGIPAQMTFAAVVTIAIGAVVTVLCEKMYKRRVLNLPASFPAILLGEVNRVIERIKRSMMKLKKKYRRVTVEELAGKVHRETAQSIAAQIERELDHFPESDNNSDDDEDVDADSLNSECAICLDSVADTTLLPCEHHTCGACQKKLPPICPFCRAQVATVASRQAA